MSDAITVDIRAERLLASLAGSGDRLQKNLRSKVDRLAIEVQAAVKEKLSGGVLHVQTGTLRRSINQKVTETDRSIVAKVGTNVRYAAIHEYGYDGPVNVPAHTRAGHDVRAYVMQMHMPKRSFLRSTLDEQAGRIRTELRAAAIESIQFGGGH